MSRKKSTTHVRISKKLRDELITKHPDVKMPDLLQVMYNTSLLKLENKLRDDKKKRKK